MAVELNERRTMNPLVNAGAIATTSLVPGDTGDEKWARIHDVLSRFAGRELTVNEGVYDSESASNLRNQGIAHLLQSYGRLYFDPDVATDVYTRQCSLEVTVHDLAVMGATLANGGVNPMTGERVVVQGVCRRVLAVMATAGLYELSGEWLYEIGVPGKSGVSGGIVTISPGKGGLATFSPPLDAAGNSVRGQLVTKYLAERLGLNLFASEPAAPNAHLAEDGRPVVRHADDGPAEPGADVGDRLGLGEGRRGADVGGTRAPRRRGRPAARGSGPSPAGGPLEHLPVAAGVAGGEDRAATELGLDVADLDGALVGAGDQVRRTPQRRPAVVGRSGRTRRRSGCPRRSAAVRRTGPG